ncbi:MAG: winged helix-turn-helix transcriptional regulator [Rhodobacteraceae bacterium]|nr:winged helix-turn-helix transcriptional regulator [Paracoccaceae bacterium]
MNDFMPCQPAVIAERVSREFSAPYRERFGISRPEWRVIAHTWAAAPVSVREVHRRVATDGAKVNRAASRPGNAGLITRIQDGADRRLLKPELSEKGRTMMAALLPAMRRT